MKNENSSFHRQALLLPSREAVNQSQVGLLMYITESLVRCLRAPEVDAGDDNPQLDGGVKSAIEAAVIQTCNRLGTVVEDSHRWSLEAQQALEKQIEIVNTAHLRLAKLQAQLAEEALKPHIKYRPLLLKVTGRWVAILGDMNDIDNSIVGLGNTPQEALNDFDGCFAGPLPENVIKSITRKNNEEQNQSAPPVDSTGTFGIKADAFSGNDESTNGKIPESDSGLSGPPTGPDGTRDGN